MTVRLTFPQIDTLKAIANDYDPDDVIHHSDDRTINALLRKRMIERYNHGWDWRVTDAGHETLRRYFEANERLGSVTYRERTDRNRNTWDRRPPVGDPGHTGPDSGPEAPIHRPGGQT